MPQTVDANFPETIILNRSSYMQIMLKRNASSATAERLFHF